MNLPIVASLASGLALVAACGGKVVVDHEGAGGAGGGSGDGGSGNRSSNDSTTTGPPAVTVGPTVTVASVGPSQVSSTGTGNFDCSNRPDFQACAECCVSENPDGYDSLVEIYVSHCACGPRAPCLAECNTGVPNDVCNGGDLMSNFDCSDCLNNVDPNEPCVGQYYDECLGDRGCSAIIDCFGQCP